ncbi:triose-phosphate isomerase [bacterium]|nr:triose-phosphate isomerase [bacterium]|tara:strand:- start:29744 stop:30424 length:681 start_codon:yes stop_codon:yes gene_type:complete
MKKLIIANWKMNPINLQKAERLFSEEDKKFDNLEIIICAPFVYLKKGMGAQDCYFEKKGAFTGEISAWMLSNIGVKYVILGHSERREKCSLINKKIKSALRARLRPIICISKSSQLKARLKNIKSIKNIIIAYEPVWAIGTGKPCSTEKAQEIYMLIKRILTQLYSRKMSDKTAVVYGGSVNEKNAKNYILSEAKNSSSAYNLDGLLIGGASLDSKKFIKICDSIN